MATSRLTTNYIALDETCPICGGPVATNGRQYWCTRHGCGYFYDRRAELRRQRRKRVREAVDATWTV
jgi:hypothetical protein